jgi:hypothetical protein
MDVIKENIVKFIDTMIVDNYSTAHKYLEVLIHEKVKGKIKKASNLKPFGKKEDEEESKKKSKKKDKMPAFLKKIKEKGSKTKK